MPFACDPIIEKEFETLGDLYQWVKTEEDSLVRIPILGLVENGAHFLDDEYFGGTGALLKFNTSGIRSFCSLIGLSLDTVNLKHKTCREEWRSKRRQVPLQTR